MSINKDYRERWCKVMLEKSIELFNTARRLPKEAETPLGELARRCANTIFQEYADTIVGDKEATAKLFMTTCREGFREPIAAALIEVQRKPEEARVM